MENFVPLPTCSTCRPGRPIIAPTDPAPTGRPLVFGEVLFDVFDGDTEVLGGAPFNVAWHLRGFGLEPRFLGARGDDARGRRIAEAFDAHGLDRTGLQITPDHPTGVVHAEVDGADVTYDIVTDVAWDHVDAADASAAVEDLDASILVHGSLALRAEDTRAAFEAVRDRIDAPLFCDANLRPPHTPIERVRAVLDHATWAKVNDDELAALTDARVEVPSDAADAAVVLARRHDLRAVIVTLGAQGACHVSDQGEAVFVPAPPLDHVVDPVGAGDAFASVTVIGLLHGWLPAVMLERAHAFAGRIVGRRGATLDDPAEYARIVATWQEVSDE